MIEDIEKAQRAFLTQPGPGIFIVNYQLPGQDGVIRIEVTADHVRGFVADGAAMAFRSRESVA